MTDQVEPKPGCLASLFGLFLGRPSTKEQRYKTAKQYPYRVRDDFLSAAEKSFYHVLRSVVAEKGVICPKVSLWDIFFVARPHEHPGAKAHIDRKHVDFLVCQPGTMQPVVGIELDDASHQKPKRQQRDAEVDAVFAEAQLPLLHIPVQRGYDTRQIAQALAPYLSEAEAVPTGQATVASAVPVDATDTPLCPKCGTPMVIRVAKQGSRAGEKFYACPNYPKCRSVLPVEPAR